MKSHCLDLRAMFGHSYRIRHENGGSAGNDPWLHIIPCRHGHIYPHGGSMLGASTNYRGSIAKRLRALPGVRVWQDADDGINVIFDVAHFAPVAKLMKPRSRRRLSDEHRRKLLEAGRRTRFGNGARDACKSSKSTQLPSADTLAV